MNQHQIIKIFKAKAWRVFLILFTSSFIGVFFSDSIIDHALSILSVLLTYGWWMMLGTGLTKSSGLRYPKYILFVVVSIVMVVASIAARIFTATRVFPDIRTTGNVIVVIGLFSVVSLAIICGYVAKSLLIAEKGGKIRVRDYIGEAFLILFWPGGNMGYSAET